VVDTGVALDHPSLRGRIAVNRAETRGNGRDDDGNGYIDDHRGYNAAAGRGDAKDDHGHGTHVTGIIAAANNAKRHSVGLCRSVQVVPVRFMDANGAGNTSGSAEGIVYAVRAGAKVINCSYTSPTRTQVERDAIAFARGVLAAAGSAIESTWLHRGYRSMSGTSMAAPAVTSAAAALKSRRGWNYHKLRARIMNTVTNAPALRNRTAARGRLNFERAVGTS
jgi:subtilisin family serine protease